jgi:hypothetical protein
MSKLSIHKNHIKFIYYGSTVNKRETLFSLPLTTCPPPKTVNSLSDRERTEKGTEKIHNFLFIFSVTALSVRRRKKKWTRENTARTLSDLKSSNRV